MTRRRILLISSLPLAVAVTIGVLIALSPRDDVTKANFDRIEVGMTLGEVEQILGGKSHAQSWFMDIQYWRRPDGAMATINFRTRGLAFDAVAETVTAKHWTESTETVFQAVLRLLHCQRSPG